MTCALNFYDRLKHFQTQALLLALVTSIICSFGATYTFAAPATAQQAASNLEDPVKAYQKAAESLKLQTEPANYVWPTVESKKRASNFTLPTKLLLIPAAIFLILVSWSLIKHLIKAKALKINSTEKDTQASPDLAALDKIRHDADLLAKQGCYTEAMHALLLNTIEELKKQIQLTFPSSLTSREIVNNLGLTPQCAATMGQIVSKVELCWFGSQKPQEEDYLQCRTNFELFRGLLAKNPKPQQSKAVKK
jgi:hypothetical protein